MTIADGGNRMTSYELPLQLSGSSRDVDLPLSEDPISAYFYNWTCFNLNKNETCLNLEKKLLNISQTRTPNISA